LKTESCYPKKERRNVDEARWIDSHVSPNLSAFPWWGDDGIDRGSNCPLSPTALSNVTLLLVTLKELRNVGKVNSNRSLRISCLVRMQMLFERGFQEGDPERLTVTQVFLFSRNEGLSKHLPAVGLSRGDLAWISCLMPIMAA
jgi:hypothetical protein